MHRDSSASSRLVHPITTINAVHRHEALARAFSELVRDVASLRRHTYTLYALILGETLTLAIVVLGGAI